MVHDGYTKLCASIAYPNRGTKSPIMHNAGFQAIGLNYVYVAFEPKSIEAAIQAMRSLGICGYSISKPYKQEVMQYLDEIDPVASAIGAVNIVHNIDGHLKGYNSDWIGALNALTEKTSLKDKRAIVIGAGGAARSIVYGLRENGVDVRVYNRTLERAVILARELQVTLGGSLEDLSKAKDYDIIINATTVGSFPNTEESVVPIKLLHKGLVAQDVVFMPKETTFLQEARRHECETVDGIRMLALQGEFAFETFTGCKAPIDVMQAALETALQQ